MPTRSRMGPAMGASGGRRMSISLALSYVFDWIVIILIAIAGGLFTLITPNRHPFSLADPNLSYPLLKDTVSTTVLVVVCLVAPAIIIFLIVMIFVPGPTARGAGKALIWRRKLWEWNTGWLGLALSLALTFMLTDGMKGLFGKPRPNLIARCIPDIANIQKYVVGGLGNQVPDGQLMVSWQICTQTNMEILNDGFAAFPSGHSSFSWAGLAYLTLFLCSKFAIAIPYLLPGTYASTFSHHPDTSNSIHAHKDAASLPPTAPSSTFSESKILRSQAAAPPVYLLIIAFIPIGVAIYISSTRYADSMHFGFDILASSLLGLFFAWFGFRWFHAPIRRGAGWSWGPRSHERAWGAPLGVQGYAGGDVGPKRDDDLEAGAAPVHNGVGHYNGPADGMPVHNGAGHLSGAVDERAGVNGGVIGRDGL